jgi:hypothetical protein
MPNYFRTDGWVKAVQGPAVPGAQIFVCTQPANIAFAPPTPLANIFSDVNGLVPITQPILTDGFGHYDFYAVPAIYTIVVAIGNQIQQVYPDQSVGGGTQGGGTALTIMVNGTTSADQLALNLESSDTSVTITDLGGGNINFQVPAAPPPVGAVVPDYMFGAGGFQLPFNSNTALNVGTHTDLDSRVYCHRFNNPYALNFTKLSCTGASNLGGGGNVNFGLYSDVGNLLFSTGALHIPNSSETDVDITLSPAWVVNPGVYFLAWAFSDIHVSVWGWDLTQIINDNGAGTEWNFLNRNGVVNFGYAANLATVSVTSMPATLGALTAASVPASNNSFTPAVMLQK